MNRKQFRPKWKYASNIRWRCMGCGAQFRENSPVGWEARHARGNRWLHEGFVAVSTDVTSPKFGNCK